MWWILGLDPLQTASLAASAGPLPPSSVDQSPFSAASERLLQRLAIEQSVKYLEPSRACQTAYLDSAQARVEMGDMHAVGSHPARTLGLCAAHKAPGHHRGSPSCARGAGKGRVSGLVGRVGALKSCPYANLRAGLAEIPNTLGGHPEVVALWRAGLRAEEGARKPPALSQRSPWTFHLHPDPGQPLLNLPLCLRNWRPAQLKIMVTTTA